MKALRSFILAAILAVSAVPGSYAAEKLTRISPGCYQLFQEGETISGVLRRGIDVSHWSEEIDWETVGKNDVDFVFLGTRYAGEVDPRFDENAKGAEKAGIDIGVYIYSYASSRADAEAEADFVLDLIKDYPISYPVVFDAENSDTLGSLPKDEITAIVKIFCDKIRAAGYYPMLYANDHWLHDILDMDALSEYPVWAAAYERLPKYEGYVIWQCTETGSVPGINDTVDIDFQFKEFPGGIPADTWRKIAGKDYYYRNHRMVKDSLINDGNASYFMDSEGLIYKGGWKIIDGREHWFDQSTGVMKAGGIQEIEGKRYVFLNDGSLADGWAEIGGNWYFAGKDGIAQTGVINVNEVLYAMDDDGVMKHDTDVEYLGVIYTADASGRLVPKADTAEQSAEAAAAADAPASVNETAAVPADPAAVVPADAAVTGAPAQAEASSSGAPAPAEVSASAPPAPESTAASEAPSETASASSSSEGSAAETSAVVTPAAPDSIGNGPGAVQPVHAAPGTASETYSGPSGDTASASADSGTGAGSGPGSADISFVQPLPVS